MGTSNTLTEHRSEVVYSSTNVDGQKTEQSSATHVIEHSSSGNANLQAQGLNMAMPSLSLESASTNMLEEAIKAMNQASAAETTEVSVTATSPDNVGSLKEE